jgi:hypothetical protein
MPVGQLSQCTVPADTHTQRAAACRDVPQGGMEGRHSAGKGPGTVSMYGRRTSLYRAFHNCALSAFMSMAVSGCHLRAALHPNHAHIIFILQWSCIVRCFVLSCETRSSTNLLTAAGRHSSVTTVTGLRPRGPVFATRGRNTVFFRRSELLLGYSQPRVSRS